MTLIMIVAKICGIFVAGIIGLWCVAWGFLGIGIAIDTFASAKKEAKEWKNKTR